MTSEYTELQRHELCNPHSWVAKGKQLFYAAGVIKAKVDEYWAKEPRNKDLHGHIDVFMMLCSYSLENLLKGLIVLRERPAIEQRLNNNEPFNAIIPEKHKLYQLAKRAGLATLADEKRALLERLTRSAVWAAQYPAPLRPDEYQTEDPFGMIGKGWAPINTYTGKDADEVLCIAKAVFTELNKTVGQQGPSPDAKPGAAGRTQRDSGTGIASGEG